MKFLVTGVAGFIGYHTCVKLLKRGTPVIGVDMVNDYYDVTLKEARLANLAQLSKELDVEFTLVRENIANKDAMDACFEKNKPSTVINLAAQAGVRYSLENPHAYVESNLVGFTNLLEACRYKDVEHLVYASTSSVYGANKNMPFSEHNGVDHPLQFYAATKRANELMAHSYSHLFNLPTTGLRFFTVYGPWGRPDMALFLFTKNILEGKPIKVFNYGDHIRDFTFVEDIVEGVVRVADKVPEPNESWDGNAPDPCTSTAPFRIYNIGNSSPVKLMDYIGAVELALGKKAELELLPMQLGDVPNTFADVSELQGAVDFLPRTNVNDGVKAFVDWYRDYYEV